MYETMSNTAVMYGSEDIEEMVLSEVGKISKAKQHPCIDSICKALHKGKGLTEGMVMII